MPYETGSLVYYVDGDFFHHGNCLYLRSYSQNLDAYQILGSTVWIPSSSLTQLRPEEKDEP